MDREIILFNKILSNDRLIKIVNRSLSNIINVLINNYKFDNESFLSDDITKFGNIGCHIDSNDLYNKLMHIRSESSTIREKVSAITNSLSSNKNSESDEKYVHNNIKLLHHIQSHINDNNKWIVKRRHQIELITETIANNTNTLNQCHLWAPIYYVYPNYQKKFNNIRLKIKQCINGNNNFDYNIYGIDIKELHEPLSNYELKFIKSKCNIDKSSKLPMITGKYIYSGHVDELLERKKFIDININKDTCISGISGHTLLLLELTKVIDTNWIPMLFACIISQFPFHHSLIEIFDAVCDMNITDTTTYNSDNYLTFFVDIANYLNVSL